MEKKSIVVENTYFKFPTDAPMTVKLFAKVIDGKEMWVDYKGECYGPASELPKGWSLVVKDEDAEYYHGAKIVTGWEHNMCPSDMSWLSETQYAPAYVYSMLRRAPSDGRLYMETSLDDFGCASGAEKLMLEMFARMVIEYATREEMDPQIFLQQVRTEIENIRKEQSN